MDAIRMVRLDQLEVGHEVRWKQRGRWRHGKLAEPPVARDGSLRVYDDFNGAERALRPSVVERLDRGPRGGRRWVPVDPGGMQWPTDGTTWRSPGRNTDAAKRVPDPGYTRSASGGGIAFG